MRRFFSLRALPLALCALPLFCASCKTGSSRANSHWNAQSIGPEIGWYFLGYEVDEDENYGDRLEKDGRHVGLTLQRHFLSVNPDNPFQGGVDEVNE